MGILIQPMEARHWPAIRGIYIAGIETGMATFETSAPTEWERWQVGKLAECRLVACANGLVIGWAALSPVSKRAVYRGVAEVSVYVAAVSRGSGVGTSLMARLVEDSERAGIWTLQASIFPENVTSIHLHERFGFRVVGRRERIGQLAGKWRDTVLMERRSTQIG